MIPLPEREVSTAEIRGRVYIDVRDLTALLGEAAAAYRRMGQSERAVAIEDVVTGLAEMRSVPT